MKKKGKKGGKAVKEAAKEGVKEGYIDIPGRGRYHRGNRLNDLTNKEWLKFQKSWFVLNPKPREKGVLLHPAKFPEELVGDFIRFFTKKGQLVLDPMAGTGSTLLAAAFSARGCIGIELNQRYADITTSRLNEFLESSGEECFLKVVQGDARDAVRILDEMSVEQVDYCITSPPYWDMLKEEGFETRRERQEKGLDVYYSDNSRDLGNVEDYEEFVRQLADIYFEVYKKLKSGGYMTVVVKNVLKGGTLYPLAWDIAKRITTPYEGHDHVFVLKDERIWCQDNQSLAPYGYRYAWVSNTFHHYCLNFRKEL